jgi:hypothetical protein
MQQIVGWNGMACRCCDPQIKFDPQSVREYNTITYLRISHGPFRFLSCLVKLLAYFVLKKLCVSEREKEEASERASERASE